MVLDAHTACCSVVALFVMQAVGYVRMYTSMQCAHGHGLAALRANDAGGGSDIALAGKSSQRAHVRSRRHQCRTWGV